MKRYLLFSLTLSIASFCYVLPTIAQETTDAHDHDHSGHDHAQQTTQSSPVDHSGHDHSDHSGHEHVSSEALILNDSTPGFVTANLFVIGTVGAFESGSNAGEFATSEHDPLDDAVFQGIDLDIGLHFNEALSALVTGFGHQTDEEWEAELEEAKLEVVLNDSLVLTAGQYLSAFGSQNERHLHAWDFVNSNLVDARMLNEAELISQGGEIAFVPGGRGNGGPLFTFGFGRARSHDHGHGHGHGHSDEEDHDDEEHHDEEEHEENHFEAEEGNIEENFFTFDVKVPFPSDESLVFSGSFAIGENGFGRNSVIYGVGARKIFNGGPHDGHGHGFSAGALQLSGDFIGRQVNGMYEDGTLGEFNDYGISATALYGLSDACTLGFRYGWVSDVDVAEIASRQRFSTAATCYFGPNNMVRGRIQYDYNHSDDLTSEHVAWLQFMIALSTGGHGHAH